MYNFLLKFHSGWAYLVIILGLALFFALLLFVSRKMPKNTLLRKLSLYATLCFHIQFLAGLLLFIVSDKVKNGFENFDIKNSAIRMILIEHPLMMIAAVLFITLANASIKRSEVPGLKPLIFVVIAMACVFAMIPWNVWP